MKNCFSITTISLLILVSLSSCLSDECDQTYIYTVHVPVFKTLEDLERDIAVIAPQELQNPGKIYYYKHYLLINELKKGVHIYDNSQPHAPVNIGFLDIPGNVDIAIHDDILYADMYMDLIAVDILNPREAKLLSRESGIFSSHFPHTESGYIVDYIPTEERISQECSDPNWGVESFWIDSDLAVMDMGGRGSAAALASGSIAGPTGIGGSMARFSVVGDHLYALDKTNIETFDISSTIPERKSTTEVTWNIETLFPYKDHLFVGAQNGMYIYSLSDPNHPSYQSEFVHARACDPVFVADDIAFVTLRDGSLCRNFINQMEVLDVSDLTQPEHLYTYTMLNPHGLSIVDNTLYLCEGSHGLKVFDINQLDKINSNLKNHLTGFHSYDVIALGGLDLALVVGEDGIHQYDISRRHDPQLISSIPVSNP